MIRRALLVAACLSASAPALAGCVLSDELTDREVARYGRVATTAQLDFAPGGLSRADVVGDQILFPPFTRVPGKPVTCRSDVVVAASGAVAKICTLCTDEAAGPRSVSDTYARALNFKPGADGRRGAMTFAYAPQRSDGSLIVPRIAAPTAPCEPQPVST